MWEWYNKTVAFRLAHLERSEGMNKLNEVRLHAKPVDCDVCME